MRLYCLVIRHNFCILFNVMFKRYLRVGYFAFGWLWILLSSCQSFVFFSSKGGTHSPSVNAKSQYVLDKRRQYILAEANRWIGVPYCLGGKENCVDCSGLTQNVYEKVGIFLPRTAEEQSKLGKLVPFDELKEGDLLFFGRGNRITHVAIYAGNGLIIHSASSRGVVRENFQTMARSFLFAKRLIE